MRYDLRCEVFLAKRTRSGNTLYKLGALRAPFHSLYIRYLLLVWLHHKGDNKTDKGTEKQREKKNSPKATPHMASDSNINRPFPSLVLLGIVDFCCILIGLEQISVNKIASGAIWISVGVGSGLIGFYWSQIKRAIASMGTWFKKKSSKLVIHWANYRAVENAGEVFEVDKFLRQIISGDSLVFDIENHNFVVGGENFVPRDPLPFKEKRLQVNYSYGLEPARTTERREHGRLLLPEDSKIKWLMGEVDRLKAVHSKPSLPLSRNYPRTIFTVEKVFFDGPSINPNEVNIRAEGWSFVFPFRIVGPVGKKGLGI